MELFASLCIVAILAALATGIDLGATFDTSQATGYWPKLLGWYLGFMFGNAVLACLLYLILDANSLLPGGPCASAFSTGIGYPVLVRSKLLEVGTGEEKIAIGPEELHRQAKKLVFHRINKILKEARLKALQQKVDEASLKELFREAFNAVSVDQLLSDAEKAKILAFFRDTFTSDDPEHEKKTVFARYILFGDGPVGS